MNKAKVLFLLILSFVSSFGVAQGVVEINNETFPDSLFRDYLRKYYHANDILTEDIIENVVDLSIRGVGIKSLKGIEYLTSLRNLDCGNTQLTDLDVSKCTVLETLYCDGCNLKTLNISGAVVLKEVYCSLNQLTDLKVSGCDALGTLRCSYNQLVNLDVSECSALRVLECSGNQLDNLNVLQNVELIYLDCSYNKLSDLDVAGCPDLKSLYCHRNMIRGKSMDTFINSLPNSFPNSLLHIYNNNYGDEGNVCSKSQVAAAQTKGWIPEYYDDNAGTWREYEGSNDDELTDIILPSVQNADINIYDLLGKRVNNLEGKKGIYIIGGKKVLKK